MKKILTLIVMAVAFAAPSHAQTSFGIQGGLNLTSMSDFSFSQAGVEEAVENRAGFFVGPTVKFTLPIVGLGVDIAALIKSQSIQVPLNVRYGFGLGSMAEIFAFAGPQFGFNIGDKTKSWTDAQNVVRDWTLKSSNLSANVGLGATVKSHLQLKVNYNIALGKTGEMEVSDATGAVFDIVKDGKANSWQVSATYFF